MGVGGQRYALAALPLGKRHGVPFYKRMGGPGRVQKIYPPPEFDAETVQPIASSYTDYPSPHLHLMSHANE